jgi:predicted AlkP superfamily phosphohydrolase/phosphomutase
MDALYRSFDDRAEVILSQLGHHDWDLLVGVISSADRVQHVMWRLIDSAHPMFDPVLAVTFGPAVERIYRRIDQFVGKAVDMIEPGTLVLVVSGHGFHSWRRAVNLNTWLVQEGFMALRLSVSAEKTREDLFGDGQFWEHVDWSRTRAYAMGLGQIYFNLQGREVQGIVHPGAEYETLADELGARLLAMIDPATGTRIVRAVYARDDVYAGRYVGNAPDLQVGFADGYRVSWETTLGGAPPDVVYDNMSRWSGDHGGYDAATTPGVLISNRPVDVLPARIVDIAPTVLRTFGIPLPTSLDGRPLFR